MSQHSTPEHDSQVTQEMATDLPRTPVALVRQVVKDYRLVASTKYGGGPLLVLLAVSLVTTYVAEIQHFALPYIRRDFNVSLTKLTALGSVFAVFPLIGLPLVGYLSDRRRRTRMVGISAVAAGVFGMATGGAPNALAFSALGAARGVAGEVGGVPLGLLSYDYYPIEARAKIVSIQRVVLSIATFGAPVATGFLVQRFGWRACVTGSAVPLMLVGLYAAFKLPEPVRGYWERRRVGVDEDLAELEQPPLRFAEAWRSLMANKTFRRLIILSPLTGLASSGFSFLFTFYLIEKFHLSPIERGLLAIPGSILAPVALVFGGVLADAIIKDNPRRVLVIGAVLGMVSTVANVIIVIVPSLALMVLMGIVISLASALIQPATAVATSLIVPPRLRGQGVGVLAIVALPGLILAPLPAYVGDRYGLHTALLMFAPLSLLGGLLHMSASRFMNADMRAAIASANATNEYARAKREGRIKLLLVRDVDVAYDGVQVLFNVDLTVDEGETIALLGTNGAGKSTLLKAISGIQEADNGAIFFDGVDITHKPPYEVARLGIVHMPGGRCVFPSLTVRENLDLAQLEIEGDESAADRRAEVLAYFPRLAERMSQEAGSLSGGEQQMVGLAQAFLWKPRLLMIDELSLGLSPAIVGELIAIINRIRAAGTTIILVEQSVNVALTIAERAVFMEKGEVRFDGPTAELLSRPDIMRSVYLKGSSALGGGRRAAAAEMAVDESRAILECRNISLAFGGVKALQNVSFVLHEGEALGVIGPNGAGKTTLFDVISGFTAPDEGKVFLDGVDISKLTPPQRAKKKMVRRFQDARLFASLTVFEAICVALDQKLDVHSALITALQLPAVRRSENRIRIRADRLIELLDLGAYRDKFVSDLSTGLRRVVDLACVLAAEPRVLLLDEPSSGIAQAEAESLGPLLRRVRYETGCSMMVIEHDMPLIRVVSDELLALVLGQVVTRGPADAVLEHPLVVDAYLGTSEEALHRSGLLKR